MSKAVQHLLRQMQRDGRLAYLIGPGSQTFDLLTQEAAETAGRDVEKYRQEFEASLTFEPVVPEAAPSADAVDAERPRPSLPALNDDLREILGRPSFACSQLAFVLRAMGHDIKPKAEHEQAAVLHWMLGIYFEHGPAWADEVGRLLSKAADAARQQEQERGNG